MNEKILSRIQKLLTMANRGSIHEKEVAMIKAQKMMLDYRIEMADVLGVMPEEVVEICCNDKVNCYTNWIMKLSQIITENFRCLPLYSHVRGVKGKIENLLITGLKQDAEICKEIMEFAVDVANKESKKIVNWYYKRGYSTSGIKQDFMNGFFDGIKEGFYQQIIANNRFALVVIPPQEVVDYCSLKKSRNIKSLKTNEAGCEGAEHYGYQTGYKVASGTFDQKSIDQKNLNIGTN